jgi:hypothetical protein
MKCNKPTTSWRKGKKKAVLACDDGDEKVIHYGADGYDHNYSYPAKKSFRARHKCDDAEKGSKLTARYWACKDLWPQGAIMKKKNSTVRINPSSLHMANYDAIINDAIATAYSDVKNNKPLRKHLPNHFYLNFPEKGSDELWFRKYTETYYYVFEVTTPETDSKFKSNPLKKKNSTVRIDNNPKKPIDIAWNRIRPHPLKSAKSLTHRFAFDDGVKDASNQTTTRLNKYKDSDELLEMYYKGYAYAESEMDIISNPNDSFEVIREASRKNPHTSINSFLTTKENAKKSTNPSAYGIGFRDGYRGHAADITYTKNKDIEIREDYLLGFYDGRDRYHVETYGPFEENPNRYFPKAKLGRPAGGPKGGYWWKLETYDSKGRKIETNTGKGTKEQATLGAKQIIGKTIKHKKVEKAILSGPFKSTPGKKK